MLRVESTTLEFNERSEKRTISAAATAPVGSQLFVVLQFALESPFHVYVAPGDSAQNIHHTVAASIATERLVEMREYIFSMLHIFDISIVDATIALGDPMSKCCKIPIVADI